MNANTTTFMIRGRTALATFAVRLVRRCMALALFLVVLGWAGLAGAQQRFPPPEFESGHELPQTTTPPARAVALEYLDVMILLGGLGLATWLVYRKRSRRGLVWLSVFSLVYFGFYRKGCLCAIGSIQNVALGLCDPAYAIPVVALVFFVAPLVTSFLGGRTFCAAVCPHGALQDLVLVKPVNLPVWLEEALSVVPFFYLGAAVFFAGTGTAFVVCRYDPFVPLFRLSGGVTMVLVGVAFVVVAMFVGRPYCRFLCPYGVLLKLGGHLAKWRVRVTPDLCTQCRLCEASCPFGAMREPTADPISPRSLPAERRRLAGLLVLLPLLVGLGAWSGSLVSRPASHVHPTVALAEQHLRNQEKPIQAGPQTAQALALKRAGENPGAILSAAAELRRRFLLAGCFFGGWVGLVIGLKLIGLSIRHKRTDYEPDRGACLACARCFAYCPNELQRLGLGPALAGSNPGDARPTVIPPPPPSS